ncbi:16S rRNA (adenine(1518)-N(6)/adenine(1519)-N(6))-dimethyltransferase RsmA [Litoribacillus peritrichatus]|uniref:Ribosomal RNA small subunit methyltransferase A n=1 Tax=Litoribacillus peritrichatus TaxID=718191 RepID=A0ABP7LXH9_9GAMM
MSSDHQHRARKRFGQNFLHDHHVIDNILAAVAAKPGDNVVEIGPGQGAITEGVLKATEGKLNVVELDRDLIPILESKFNHYPDFKIHQGDALQYDFGELVKGTPLKVVGNLPYNISTPLIFHLLSYHEHIKDMHFMLQKEVVNRLGAGPRDSNYGRLSIMVQYYCQVQPLFVVKPGSFHPVPKVDSAVVRMVPYQTLPFPAKNIKTLEKVVRQAFSMRRKTLRNTLKGTVTSEQLEALGIDPSARPETLTVEQYVKISDAVS